MDTIKKMVAGIVLLLSASMAYPADNLVFNSSFELGMKGWSGVSESYVPDNNFVHPEARYCVDSKYAYSGEKSLRLFWKSNNFQVNSMIDSHNFIIKPGKKYTVSFWAKSSVNNTAITTYALTHQRMVRRDSEGNFLPDIDFKNCSHDKMDHSEIIQFKTSTEWKRYSYSFIPKAGYSAYSFRLNLYVSEKHAKRMNLKEVSVYIDCIQVQEGSLTAYMPKAEVEAAVYTTEPLYENIAKVKGKIEVISYNEDKNIDISAILFDTFFEKKLIEKKKHFNLKKGITLEKPIEFKSIPYGMFCIYTGLQPRTTPPGFYAEWDKQPECLNYDRVEYSDESYQSAAYFANVGTPQPYSEEGFRMGPTGGFSRRQFQTWTIDGISDESAEEIAQIYRLLGGNVIRCWDPSLCVWRRVNPEKGKFDWKGSDARIEFAEKAGLKVICVIGGAFTKRRKHVPFWAQKRDRSGNPEGSEPAKGTYFKERFGSGMRYFQPQLEDWREYVSAVATRYKGRIKYYELLNESDLYMSTDLYMEYMRSAAEEIRKADPGAVILGICSTADRTVDPEAETITRLGECIKLGADKYMDHITFHPYAILDNSPKVTQQDARRDHLAFLKKHDVKAGLWTGENYFIIEDWMPHTAYKVRWKPENLARFYLVDMGEGLTGSTPVHIESFVSNWHQPYFNKRQYRGNTKEYPNARFAVHAACSHFLAGAEPLYTLEFRTGAMGYIFKNGDRLLSAVWNSRSKQKTELALKVPVGANVVVYDVMGNQIKKSSGSVNLPLSARPYYVEWFGVTADAANNALNGSPILCEQSIKIERAIVLKDGDSAQLFMNARNMSGAVAKNNVITVDSDSFVSPVKLQVPSLGDFEVGTFSAPIDLKAVDGEKLNVVAVTDFGKESPVAGFALVKDVVKLSSAAQTFAIDKCVMGKADGAGDMSASFSVRYEDYKLVLDVKVKDDKRGEMVEHLYNRDCIELFIDRAPFAVGKHSQIMIPVKAGKISQKGASGTITLLEDGYEANIEMPVGGRDYIGFDIAIDDSDGKTRKSQHVWKGTKYNYKSSDGLAIVQIMHGMAARVDLRYKSVAGKHSNYRTNKNDVIGNDWSKHSFSFTPKETGNVSLYLFSGYTKDKSKRFWVDYRNITVVGAETKDLDLSKLDDNGKPVGWRLAGRAELVKDAEGNYLKSTHDEYGVTILACEVGRPVTVSYEVRAGKQVDLCQK